MLKQFPIANIVCHSLGSHQKITNTLELGSMRKVTPERVTLLRVGYF
jgi:hypothetical protein